MSLASLFEQTHKLPSIPEVVQELIKNFNDPDVDADEISRNIQKDQAISAKVMRLANSARYGAGRKINSIDSAVVMLGFDTLKTLIIASGVTQAFTEIPGFDLKAFWRDSFMVASISKQLAKRCNVDAEAAFTCGLLHNIGEALIHIGESDVEREIDRLVQNGENRIELQNNKFGFDYTGVGRELARRWNFPDDILDGIRQHATPSAFEEFSELSAVIYIARYFNLQLVRERSEEEVEAGLPTSIAEKIAMSTDGLVAEIFEMAAEDDDIDTILG